MPDVELGLLIRLRDEATAQFKQVNAQLQSVSKEMKQVGLVATAAGGAVIAMAGLSVKAFADEEKGVVRLSVALKNAGMDYARVADELERNISITERKTGIADSAQRDALSTLISLTGNY